MTSLQPSTARPQRLLDFRSGGWVLLLAGVFAVAVLLWGSFGIFQREAYRLRGDGRTVASYGFDFSTCLVPRDKIVPAGFAKDAVPAMTAPSAFTPAQADAFDHELRRGHEGKYLVPSDRVIGVQINGECRAYPLRILNWHEIVNDTLGDQPIAVTYNPLCDSVAVFDRRVGGRAVEFGVSGLLYNSNLLMYDRQPGATGESLWSQLQFRAIAGPAAAQAATLALIPAVVVQWTDWWAQHPETTLLAPDRARLHVYQRTYDAYFGSEKLHFPVDPPPPADGPPAKTPVIALRTVGNWHVFSLPDVLANAGSARVWQMTLDGVPIRLTIRTEPLTVWPQTADGEALGAVPALWFAWHAQYPDTTLAKR